MNLNEFVVIPHFDKQYALNKIYNEIPNGKCMYNNNILLFPILPYIQNIKIKSKCITTDS